MIDVDSRKALLLNICKTFYAGASRGVDCCHQWRTPRRYGWVTGSIFNIFNLLWDFSVCLQIPKALRKNSNESSQAMDQGMRFITGHRSRDNCHAIIVPLFKNMSVALKRYAIMYCVFIWILSSISLINWLARDVRYHACFISL